MKKKGFLMWKRWHQKKPPHRHLFIEVTVDAISWNICYAGDAIEDIPDTTAS